MKNLERLLRGVAQVFSRADLEKKLSLSRPLRVKLGVDPTSPDLHLGHTVALNKLRQFQDAGHTVVFIIGDYTARIGDPSGRSETRPPLSAEAVAKNAATYLDQVYHVLDKNKTEVRRNSEWLEPLFANRDADPRRTILGLMGRNTVQQLTEREDFQKRLKAGTPVSLLELLYPLLQGYDSVAVQSDVEIGGTDQLFNLLRGRDLQADFGQPPQVVMTLPLLEGTDGVKKMSKSYGNAIALNDAPEDMFGKVMSLSDAMMWKYLELLTDRDPVPLRALHPMEAKKTLAGDLVTRYRGADAATKARAHFETVFSKKGNPDDIPAYRVPRSPMSLTALMVEAGLAPSKNEARRLLAQGAVELAGERVTEEREITVHSPLLIKVGKRQFRHLTPPDGTS